MEKILIIGSPGSGKSTLAKHLSKKIHYPVLHLDRIFHIDNTHQRSREELKAKIKQFMDIHDRYIIDGNYGGTLAYRMSYADTVIIMDIPVETCLKNIEKRRLSGEKRFDIASGFDNSIRDDTFVDYVRTFKEAHFPLIMTHKAMYPDINYYIFSQYQEVEAFLDTL